MREKTRRFIADLWFVMALVMPPFGAIALAMKRCHVDGAALSMWVELLLTGPLILLESNLQDAPLFLTACALPTFWILLEALALRLAADGRSVLPTVLLWACRHVLLVLVMGGPLLYFGSTTGLVLTAAPAFLYLASILGTTRVMPERNFVFEISLGCILFERLVLPWIALAWG